MGKKVEIENDANGENGETLSPVEEENEKILAELKESLKERSEEAKSYLDHLQRLQAEFENYKKRTIAEKADLRKSGKEDLLKELLPIVDSLEKALNHSGKNNNSEFIIKGIELVHKQFQDFLKKEGVAKIDSVGKEFNPLLHEAIITEY